MDLEKSAVAAIAPAKHQHEYVTSSKLVFILVAVTLAYFLVMLDTSIVATVLSPPFVSIQCFVQRPKIPAAIAILVSMQYFGAALWVTFAQGIFSNSMRNLIPQYAPVSMQ